LTDSDKVRDRWKEYIEDLYDKNNKPQVEDVHLATDTEDDVKGPPILFSEFEAALSELKQEAQLMLTTGSTRLAVNQGQQT